MYNKEAVVKYRKTHKDKIDSYNEVFMPQYYLKNKEKFKEYYDENKDRIKEYDKLKYIKNREKILLREKRKYEFKKEWGFLLDICLC